MRQVRAKVSGVKQAVDALKKTISEALDKEIGIVIETILEKRLATNTNADGSPRPEEPFVSKDGKTTAGAGEKSPRTIKAYRRKGLNTNVYLVATGRSVQLGHKTTGTRLTVEPKTPQGKKILSYHIPESKWRGGIRLFELSDEDMNSINSRLRTILKRHGY